MKVLIRFLLICAFCILPRIFNAQTKGTHYAITLNKIKGERKGWQWTTDELTLDGSKLSSKEMKAKEKFPPAVCKVRADTTQAAVTLKFAGVTQNRGISKLKWQGTITGDKITGRAEWKNGQGVQTYTFTGIAK